MRKKEYETKCYMNVKIYSINTKEEEERANTETEKVRKLQEYVKQSVVDRVRVVCDLAGVERKNPMGSSGPMRLKLLRRRDDILK